MKLPLLLLLLTSPLCFAQNPNATWYGPDAERYKGLHLKVVDSPLPYANFILDKEKPLDAGDNTYLPAKELRVSDPAKLLGKEFSVTDVTEHPTKTNVYYLVLKEATGDQLLYYYYDPGDPKAKEAFPLQVMRDATGTPIGKRFEETAPGPFSASTPPSSRIDEGDYCSRIAAERDKFNGSVSYHSPYTSRYNLLIYKDVTKAKVSSYMLALFTTGSTVNTSIKGVIILLDNGVKISRPAVEVDVEPRQYDTHGQGDFEYSAYIHLTPAERALLLKHRITDFRLYIYDQEIDQREGEALKQYLTCLTGLK